jgi:hypothetical protein
MNIIKLGWKNEMNGKLPSRLNMGYMSGWLCYLVLLMHQTHLWDRWIITTSIYK